MARTGRQLKLIELISKNEIETQDALADALRIEGYNVTQATVSRDIKDLGLIKVMTQNKTYKYAQPQPREQKTSGKLLNLFRESVVSVDASFNLIVIKTISGSANSAAALIDKMSFPEVIGCVAGDDTILIVVKSLDKVEGIVDKLKSLME
ncbi:MAG: arginine repressor [Clostridia bacterium]